MFQVRSCTVSNCRGNEELSGGAMQVCLCECITNFVALELDKGVSESEHWMDYS